MYDAVIHTCIIEAQYVKDIYKTWCGDNRDDFRCECGKYYMFSIEDKDEI